MACGECQNERLKAHKFCSNCGERLAPASSAPASNVPVSSAHLNSAPSARTPSAGASAGWAPADTISARAQTERRQITVLFYDLVGSTKLSTSVEPEDFREAISNFHTVASAAVRLSSSERRRRRMRDPVWSGACRSGLQNHPPQWRESRRTGRHCDRHQHRWTHRSRRHRQ